MIQNPFFQEIPVQDQFITPRDNPQSGEIGTEFFQDSVSDTVNFYRVDGFQFDGTFHVFLILYSGSCLDSVICLNHIIIVGRISPQIPFPDEIPDRKCLVGICQAAGLGTP